MPKRLVDDDHPSTHEVLEALADTYRRLGKGSLARELDDLLFAIAPSRVTASVDEIFHIPGRLVSDRTSDGTFDSVMSGILVALVAFLFTFILSP